MVKIIKRGTPPTEVIHRVTCFKCKSDLEFAQGEAQITSDQRDGVFMTITCPVCDSVVTKSLNNGTTCWAGGMER